MNFLEISPYVFGDGGLTWYSIFVLTGAILVLIISNYLYKKDPESKKCPDLIFDVFLVGFPMGLVGARIWFVFSELDYYLANPLSILKVWEGGLAIQGGVILGAICGIWFGQHLINKHGVNIKMTRLMDMVIPNILLAQVVGRWGNFFNREVYGACVNREDIWFIPDFIANNMKGGFVGDLYVSCPSSQYAQPLFLYEGLLNLLGFILISIVLRKFFTKRVDGTLTGLYLIYYGTVRACLEGLRNEQFIMRWGSVSQSLVTSIVYIILGVGFITYVYLKHYGIIGKKKAIAGVEDNNLQLQEAKEVVAQSNENDLEGQENIKEADLNIQESKEELDQASKNIKESEENIKEATKLINQANENVKVKKEVKKANKNIKSSNKTVKKAETTIKKSTTNTSKKAVAKKPATKKSTNTTKKVATKKTTTKKPVTKKAGEK